MFCSSLLIDKLLLVRVKFVLLEGNELFKNENIYLKEENISKKKNRGEKEKEIKKLCDEDGIRTHACRAHWISSPTP